MRASLKESCKSCCAISDADGAEMKSRHHGVAFNESRNGMRRRCLVIAFSSAWNARW